MKLYRHKKTGKLYELISDKFLVKNWETVDYECDAEGRPLGINKATFEWDNEYVLYKATYENPDGPYFARTTYDFFKEFEEVEIPNKEMTLPTYGSIGGIFVCNKLNRTVSNTFCNEHCSLSDECHKTKK